MLRCAAPSPLPRHDAASRASRYSTAIIRRPPPTTPNPTPLPIPPQDALVARCLRLEDGERRVKRSRSSGLMKLKSTIGANSAAARARAVKGSWVELKSTSPFVSMSMQYTEPEGGGSRYASNSHALNPSLRLPHPRHANIFFALASLASVSPSARRRPPSTAAPRRRSRTSPWCAGGRK